MFVIGLMDMMAILVEDMAIFLFSLIGNQAWDLVNFSICLFGANIYFEKSLKLVPRSMLSSALCTYRNYFFGMDVLPYERIDFFEVILILVLLILDVNIRS